MATTAVLIALGGTSYAVSQLPRNSVGSTQLRDAAVTSAKIKDRAVAAADLAADAPALGVRGPRGRQGLRAQARRPGLLAQPALHRFSSANETLP